MPQGEDKITDQKTSIGWFHPLPFHAIGFTLISAMCLADQESKLKYPDNNNYYSLVEVILSVGLEWLFGEGLKDSIHFFCHCC